MGRWGLLYFWIEPSVLRATIRTIGLHGGLIDHVRCPACSRSNEPLSVAIVLSSPLELRDLFFEIVGLDQFSLEPRSGKHVLLFWESDMEYLFVIFDKMDLDPFFNIRGKLVVIALSFLSGKSALSASDLRAAISFSFTSADRQDFACQRQLSCHPEVFAHRLISQQRKERGHHRDPCRRAIFGRRAFRNVDVDLRSFRKRVPRAYFSTLLWSISPGDLGGFFHHIARLAGQFHLGFFGRNFDRFDVESRAAHRCPGKPHADADRSCFIEAVGGEDRFAEISCREFFSVTIDFFELLSFSRSSSTILTATLRMIFLMLFSRRAHASFPRISVDDLRDSAVGEVDVGRFEPHIFAVARDQIFLARSRPSPPGCSRRGAGYPSGL